MVGCVRVRFCGGVAITSAAASAGSSIVSNWVVACLAYTLQVRDHRGIYVIASMRNVWEDLLITPSRGDCWRQQQHRDVGESAITNPTASGTAVLSRFQLHVKGTSGLDTASRKASHNAAFKGDKSPGPSAVKSRSWDGGMDPSQSMTSVEKQVHGS